MRFLLDTNVFIHYLTDTDSLSGDVMAILTDYDNQFYLSAESVKEMVVAFRKKGFNSKRWKTARQMVESLEDFGVSILPIRREHLLTLSSLIINEAQEHNDPSDHIIISQAITEHLALISADRKFPFYRAQGLELIESKR
ncbi:MAG: type II toxin-antitoxin system VapC family toxin [Paludibacteraceae bacterium]|nr:type II toxin-antitoxin system VapC family toxin [Paludibacteraceae bacterium]